MGLHICYELRLPRQTVEADIIALMTRLHDAASRHGFAGVSALVHHVPERRPSSLTFRDLEEVFDVWAVLIAKGDTDGNQVPDAEPTMAIGFACAPGHMSEPAAFGLVRAAHHESWYWHYCCKTQYASVVSDDHLVRCHTAVVATLDAAVALGLDVEVHDETGYWEHRDAQKLIESVHAMNRIVARFAGAFHDALPSPRRVEGAIFSHPDFERLETEGG